MPFYGYRIHQDLRAQRTASKAKAIGYGLKAWRDSRLDKAAA
jgi:hypothetical protein